MQYSKLIRKYSRRTSEQVAFEAGKKLRNGDYSRKNLKAIVKWKLNRGSGGNLDNNNRRVESALKEAVVQKKCPRKAIESLLDIHGIGVSIASAIMTTIDSRGYTIIDSRAIESLKRLGPKKLPEWIKNHPGNEKTWSLNEYLEYLDFCKKLARQSKVDLRSLDKALWQHSYEHSLGWLN